jgi:putative NADH-flavin reductase
MTAAGQGMKLIIFGGTGGTGSELLRQSLESGHDVTAVVRNRARLSIPEHANLTVVEGDVLTVGAWQASVADHDAVLSCLGSKDRRHSTSVYSRGAANIIEAMGGSGAGRFVCLSSAGVEIPPGIPLAQRLVTKLIVQRLYRHGYADMARMETIVTSSDIRWTIVRPPMLTNGPLTGHYRVAINAHLSRPRSVSRADLAHFVLAHADDTRTWKATVEISQ